MLLKIANDTAMRVDVSWGKLIGVRQNHCGFLAPHEQLAIEVGDEPPLASGEKVWVRGIADDGRIIASSFVVDDRRENLVRLGSDQIALTEELTLPEEVLELALDDSGHLRGITRDHLEIALFVAAVYELSSRGCVCFVKDGVKVSKPGPTGDHVLDLALHELGEKTTGEDLAEAVYQVAISPRQYYEAVVAGLVGKGILHSEESRLMWLVPSWTLRPANTVPESHLVHKLMKVLGLGLPGDERTDELVTIIGCCFDSPRFIEDDLLKDLDQRLHEWTHRDIPELVVMRNAISEAMTRKAMVYAAYPGGPPGSF